MNFSRGNPLTTPTHIRFDACNMYVTLRNGNEVSTPLVRFPRLLNGTEAQRKDWRVIGAGDGIHWPLLDEDISVAGLLHEKPNTSPDQGRMREIVTLIGDIYAKSSRLSRITNGRSFTPDGLFVSSAGQVIAEYIYALSPAEKERFFDARTADGKTVQIMLTSRSPGRFAVRWSEVAMQSHADLMLCLRLDENGFDEIYNGEFPVDLLQGKKIPANGQIQLSTAALADLNPALLDKQHSFAGINKLLLEQIAHAA